MRYWILFALYCLLIAYHVWYTPRSPIAKWPILQKPADPPVSMTCRDTTDCPSHHVCMGDTCLPQLLRGEECNPETGTWTRVAHRGHSFAACICSSPQLVTQKYFGGNCDEEVACKPYGYWDGSAQHCVCPEGFVARHDGPVPECRKLTALERMKHLPCESDEDAVANVHPSHGLTHSYVQFHAGKKCFKRPCKFDAMSGKPLKEARYEEGIGCVCDPTLGQFGVRIDALKDYVRGEGYNGCVSLFETPLEHPIPVDVVTYFYLVDRSPVTFLQYYNLPSNTLIEPLRTLNRFESLQIGQEFPYDYMQFFFRNKIPFRAKIYNYVFSGWFKAIQRLSSTWADNRMGWCRFITRDLKASETPHQWIMQLLYQYPVCYVAKNDPTTRYQGTFVANPFHMTLSLGPEEPRSNGLKLSYRDGKWSLEQAPEYQIKLHAAVGDDIPDLHDAVVDGVMNRRITLQSLRERKDLKQDET